MQVRLIVVLAFLMTSVVGLSQQDYRISHGELADEIRNPALAGFNSSLTVFVLHRRQWIGLEGAPNTSVFGGSYRLSGKVGGAIGLQVVDDQIGSLRNNQVNLKYAKSLRFGVTEFRIGVGLSGFFINDRTTWEVSDVETDDLLVNNNSRASFFDVNGGFFVKRNDFSLGFASNKLRNVELKDIRLITTRSFESWVGYKLQWGNKIAINTTPMLRLRTDLLAKPQVEGRLDTEINNKYWLMTGYRNDESVIVGGAMFIPFGIGKMLLGYTFDYTINGLTEYNSGSHELFIRFTSDKIDVSQKKEIKNVRFL